MLDFPNFPMWAKHQRQIGTVLGDSNKELHTRSLITYTMPVRTQKVTEDVAMENGKTTQVSSLGLYLLLEQVCTKNNVNNVEMLRTKLIDHQYNDGDCVYGFLTELDALFKAIDMAGGEEGQMKDHDKVYRLREALPKREIYKSLLMSAHTHVRGDPEYPTYEW
ncbi:hypothetical protein B484DRAFT_400017, partial [Ochromonadaceae sp. CCMP2298]